MIDTLYKYGFEEDEIIWFDAESFEEPEQYSEIFEKLLALTGEKLRLDNQDWAYFHEQNEETGEENFITSVSFTHQNEAHTIYLRCEGWFDEKLISVLNGLLSKEESISERFLLIRTDDQSLIIVLAEPATAEKLSDNGLIDDDYTIHNPKNL